MKIEDHKNGGTLTADIAADGSSVTFLHVHKGLERAIKVPASCLGALNNMCFETFISQPKRAGTK
ncbi:MAG: hypothetical protein E6R03_14765 [Hyphomicrobiaceae bacterium]|nr:MAG: hypothetical protein E6R03_14765 [Hyphomicrobiaceae bacterium]